MYIIMHNDKQYGSKQFDSYEAARSHTRKMIRRFLAMLNAAPLEEDVGGNTYNNPSINLYGYEVVAR
jgi:hypothetical protein